MYKILIIGNGAREHSIGTKIIQDSKINNSEVKLFFASGNAGTSKIGTNININSINEFVEFAKQEKINLTFVGSEEFLAKGIVDEFKKNNLIIFGPDKKAALLESSKAFAKEFMKNHNVKTAKYETFKSSILAKEYVKNQKFPLVIKASGLAAGKGVIICADEFEAEDAINQIMESKIFGDSGNEVVIEEFLQGFEVSILSIFNGKQIIPFISAKDHKKIGENETGLNTGGMGVIAPNPFFKNEHFKLFEQDILKPTLNGLLKENLIFSGIIFFGLMINQNGVYLLEYNMRLGDPETQAVLPLMKNNFLDIINKAINQEDFDLEWENKHSVCVVLTSGGYPLNFEKGFEITGLEKLDIPYFIAGATNQEDKIVTSGGRVLNVVGIDENLEKAREKAYENIKKIHFDYKYFRKDIADLSNKNN